MATIIHTAKDCTVRIYISAVFEGNLIALVIDGEATEEELITALEAIQEEYTDLAGMQKSEEFELIKQIRYLKIRLESIHQFVKIHRACIAQLGEPFHPAIQDLKKFGHRLYWNKEESNVMDFLKALDQILVKEKRTEAELMNKARALADLKLKSAGPEISTGQRRISFISLLNSLGKFGFTIDKDKTTMEELALMAKEYLDSLQTQVTDKKSK